MDEYFRTRFSYDRKREIVWKEICRYIQRYIPRNAKILDVGAGYGHFINNVVSVDKFAIDLEIGALKYCDVQTRTICGSCVSLPYKNNEFDVLFSSNVLEHLEHQQLRDALLESYRVLKVGGILMVISPNFKYCYRNYFDDYTHKSIITGASINDLFESVGFRVVKNVPRFLPFSTKGKLPVNSFLIWLYLRSAWKPFASQFFIIGKKCDSYEE
ncbi:MAG: SAM-dependent methyltransferase [Candidatus Nanohalarchaeota archaeon]|nr:MAG: SAM-dependent methyltransferase [Candidatus Nanohaloarchaeota archaeon]